MSVRKFLVEMYETFIPHAVAAHFSNGLVPVSVGFLLLALFFRDTFYEHTVMHLNIVVLLAIPCSFCSGVYLWRTRFKGVQTPVFRRKLRLSVLLMVLATTVVAIRALRPDVAIRHDFISWCYFGFIAAMLPTVTLLGHYGARLTLASRQAPGKR